MDFVPVRRTISKPPESLPQPTARDFVTYSPMARAPYHGLGIKYAQVDKH